MFFSIIIPTFNRAHLIARAIESVTNQDFPDWEMIIVDDGSSDTTGDVVRIFSERDPRISYHYSENQGAAAARNLGSSFASGRYFTFLDSDDEYLPGHLRIREEMLSRVPAIELLHGGVEVIGDPLVADCFDPSNLVPISECVVGGTFFVRRDLFKRLGGFSDIPYADDTDLYARAKELGALIEKIDNPTYRYYRTEADSLCAIVARDGTEGIERFRKKKTL
jgi:glycosyltransferase involved in cell wall biosynthesis